MNQIFHVEDYNSPLPEIMYIDTSFLYEVYSNDQENKHSIECYNFTNRLAANGTIMVVSHLVMEEMEHVILKGIYRRYAKQLRGNISWTDLYKRTKEYMPEVIDEIKRVKYIINSNPNIVDLPVLIDQDFSDQRTEMMERFYLDSRDAAHIVASFGSTINSFAVNDQDYKTVSGINIYTPNNNYVFSRDKKLLPFEATEENDSHVE